MIKLFDQLARQLPAKSILNHTHLSGETRGFMLLENNKYNTNISARAGVYS